MNRTGSFLLGLGVGMVALYLTMHFVVIHAKDGVHVIPKIAAKLELPYQDIRQFKLADWQKKQSLALSILKSQKGHLLNDPRLLSFKENATSVLKRYVGAETKSTPAMQMTKSQPVVAPSVPAPFLPVQLQPTASNSSSLALQPGR